MVEGEAGGALNIVVSSVSEGVVGADNDLSQYSAYKVRRNAGSGATHWLAAAGQLHRNKLLLVVLFEGGREVGDDVGGRDGEGLDVCQLGVNSLVVDQS